MMIYIIFETCWYFIFHIILPRFITHRSNKEYIIDAITEEVGSHFNKHELLEHYNAVSKIPYGALILSIHKKEKDENRVRLGWSSRIERDPKYIL